MLLDQAKVDALADAGLDHVQVSVQDSDAANAERIGGYKGGHAKKLAVARMVRAAGLPLTINAVVHRQNLDHLDRIIELAVELGARRLEVAHVQYYGWALANRAALMPTQEQAERSIALVEAARERLKGVLTIDYVVPDYYARYPKPCMGGWARQNLNVTPSGKVLPCHAAEGIACAHLRQRQGPPARRDLVSWVGVQRVPRHRLDAGALPQLPAPLHRLRRLPLPGVRDDRPGRGDRSRLLALAAPRGAGRDRGPRGRRPPPEFVYRRPGNAARAAAPEVAPAG